MFADIADEYFERVEECRQEAQRCTRAEDRAAWLSLAEEWLSFALKEAAASKAEGPLETERKREAA